MPAHPRQADDPHAYRDALSQWQLAARTEVKRSSSLPTSMFDACDPMLEARLADSVENMLLRLNVARDRATVRSDEQAAEKRIERVARDELQSLPGRTAGELPPLDVDEGLCAEYLGMLLDSCATANATCQDAARALLARDFGLDHRHGVEALCQEFARLLPSMLAQCDDDPCTVERLTTLCSVSAATSIAADAPADTSHGTHEERPR